ncbi:hypothetical protein [Streptomyces sp. NPDC097619]|uniref:hypothetical protein n=1 Tax=Streptomyces sp. NPDC097619 TaxID=3157228 RepID=UPI003321C8CF
MSIRSTSKVRQGAAVAAMAAALVLVTTGCGKGEEGGADKPQGVSRSSASEGKQPTQQPSADDGKEPVEQTIAEIKGTGEVVLKITKAVRESGGFVTISGTIINNGTTPQNPATWTGSEPQLLAANGNSVAGATLIDKVGKKRYYVLRDTDGRCLCTAGIPGIVPGKPISVFMQFPAPPEGTQEVDFTLPTFSTATIKISG